MHQGDGLSEMGSPTFSCGGGCKLTRDQAAPNPAILLDLPKISHLPEGVQPYRVLPAVLELMQRESPMSPTHYN